MTFVPPFLVFLAGVPLVLALPGRARRAALVAVAGAGTLTVFLLPPGETWTAPFMGYTLVLLRADPLSLFTGYIFGIITLLASLYAAAFARPWLHAYALLYAGTSLGAVFAGDFLTLLLFWEGMAITSTLLIWEQGGAAVGAGFRYLLFHIVGGALLAAGIAMQSLEAGTLLVGPATGPWASLFIALGAGVNVGFIPLHTWLPDAYPMPHIAASVFLSVYTTKAAVYLLARTSAGVEAIAVMGSVMAVYGVVFALAQNNMRRLLSYHIVSQVGYMVAGVGLGGIVGVNAGMAHVFNHILYKALLFMAVGAVVYRTGIEVMDRLGGLGRKMPVTAIAYWIAAFSIAGVPGFNGFVSKGMVVAAAQDSPVVRVLLEIASFGTMLSFLKLGYFVFLRPGTTESSDPPRPMQVAQLGTAGLCVAIGIYPALLLGILPAATTYQPYGFDRLLEASLVLGLAAVFFATVGVRVLAPHETRLRDADAAYAALARGVLSASKTIAVSFAAVYDGFLSGIRSLGQAPRRLQTGDLNWNTVAVLLGLAIILAWLLAEAIG